MGERNNTVIGWSIFAVLCALLMVVVFTTRSRAMSVAQDCDGNARNASALCDEMEQANESSDIEVRRAGEVNGLSKNDAMAALFAINHINWVITKIRTYNNPAVLEEEYRGLTADALNLRVIKDPELINVICRILDVIVEMRIEEKEREFLKDEIDQGASDALADAISGIHISGLNPVSMVVSAVTSAATAAMNYKKAKRALETKFRRQSWALDKNRMYYLNDLNKDLLRNFWAIVQKYPDLPEEYRVSDKNIKLLVDHLKDDDALKRLEFLQAFDVHFSGFQPYWYHRAAAAYEVACATNHGEIICAMAREDAKVSLKNYHDIQIKCGNILRRDETAAKAALLRIALLSEDKSDDREAYQEAIKVAVANSSPDDWQTAYACAFVAARNLNDVVLAEKILAPAISELDWQRRRRLIDWQEELEFRTSGRVEGMAAAGDALFECRTLVANVAKMTEEKKNERLKRICDDKNASVRDKMFCYGSMSYRQALEKLTPDISRMRVLVRRCELDKDKEDHYFVSVPFSWVIARDGALCLKAGEKSRQEVGERQLEIREDGKQYALIDFGKCEGESEVVSFQSRFDRPGRGCAGQSETSSFMVSVEFGKVYGHVYKPKTAACGRWRRGTATTPGGWEVNPPPPYNRPLMSDVPELGFELIPIQED